MKKIMMGAALLLFLVGHLLFNTACKKGNPTRFMARITMTVNMADLPVKTISGSLHKSANKKDFIRIKAIFWNNDRAFIDICYKDIPVEARIDALKDSTGSFSYTTAEPPASYQACQEYPGGAGEITIIRNNISLRLIEGSFSGTPVNTANPNDTKRVRGSFAVWY